MNEENIGIIVIGHTDPDDCELYCNVLGAELSESGFNDAVVVGYQNLWDYLKSKHDDFSILVPSACSVIDSTELILKICQY